MDNHTHKMEDFSTYLVGKLEEVWHGLFVKLGVTSAVIALPTTFLGLEWNVIFALVGMSFLDLVTGLVKAKKKKQPIQSKKLLNTAYKAILYSAVIAASYLITQIFPDYVSLHEWSAIFLILVEFHSVLENITQAGVILPPQIREWLSSKINIEK
jgi:phage-related holin